MPSTTGDTDGKFHAKPLNRKATFTEQLLTRLDVGFDYTTPVLTLQNIHGFQDQMERNSVCIWLYLKQ